MPDQRHSRASTRTAGNPLNLQSLIQRVICWRPRCILVLCLILFTGCSATKLAYRNLDWLISRKVNQMVDLNSSQQAWFDNQLDSALQWHCETQIPRYRTALFSLREQMLSAELNVQALEKHMQNAEQSAERLVEHSAPLISGLLQRLDDEQVLELQASLGKHLQEQYEELVAPPEQERYENSAERLSEFLQRWLGRLNTKQTNLIQQWAANRGSSNKVWLDNRQHWQGLLLKELATRQQSDFSERVRRLLVDYRQLQTPAYAEQSSRSRQAFGELLVQIMQASTAAQRKHLSDAFNDLLEDLQALDCSAQ